MLPSNTLKLMELNQKLIIHSKVLIKNANIMPQKSFSKSLDIPMFQKETMMPFKPLLLLNQYQSVLMLKLLCYTNLVSFLMQIAELKLITVS